MLQSYYQISYDKALHPEMFKGFRFKDKTFLYLVMSHQSGVAFVTGAMHLCVLIVIIQNLHHNDNRYDKEHPAR